jgi:hypothetical protein
MIQSQILLQGINGARLYTIIKLLGSLIGKKM